MEKENKNLKEKIYDYEIFIRKISHIYEYRNINLVDAAKDIIQMKKRIFNLNNLNDNLQKDNEYLRISYHILNV